MKLPKNENGSILLIFIITLPFLMLIAMNYTRMSLTSFQVARFDQLHTSAQLAADAGADYAVGQFAQNSSWTGTGGDVVLHSDSNQKTTYNATITGNDTEKTIAITGKTFWPANETTPHRTVKINVDLRPVTSSGYSVVSGQGGLVMSNSSKVIGGDVYINGEIRLSNSAQIGLSTNPVNVFVSNQRCPITVNATYPRVCNSGEANNPITITNSAKIYGTVTATHQTNSSGMSSPGLVSGTAPVQDLPPYDRAAQKAAATNNMTSSAASCSGSGTVNWPANTKITGNVTLSNSCKVTIKGNVWITGNLNTSNSSQLIVDNALGATQPVIMVDGSSGATFSNSSQIKQNTVNTGVKVITFYANSSCSPDCTTLTGTGLANSRNLTTISLGNSSAGANSTFYSYWTKVQVSNAGAIGALIGQTIELSNSGTITFSSSAGVGNTTWVVKGYRRQ